MAGNKYFWLIFASILQPWLRAELKAASFALAHSHTVYSPKQIIQQTIDVANTSWGGKSCALPAAGAGVGGGRLRSGRNSRLSFHTCKDYPPDQQ